MKYTYEKIVQKLTTSDVPVTVTFTKMDGTARDINCTLSKALIPQEKSPKGTGSEKLKENKDVIRVLDTDIQEWRSFKVASITNIVD